METQLLNQGSADYPKNCRQMYKKPDLYFRGDNFANLMAQKRVAIVGTRRVSAYGQQVTRDFARQLTERGIVIVSGLAYGVDTIAHTACLEAGGQTLAVLPSPVEAVVPASNWRLANRILASGGGLLSQYAAGSEVHKGNFVERNEVVAAVSDAVIVTEAGENSGTRHTAKFASDLSLPVLVVPGNITSPSSVGANNMLKSNDAQIITTVDDVLTVLGMASTKHAGQVIRGATAQEQCVLDLLMAGVYDGQELLVKSQLTMADFASTLTMLEISAKVVALGANQWALR